MSLDRFSTALDIKQVSEQRIISGHAAAWALDRVGDVIEPTAFKKTLSEKAPSDVAVFIGHDQSSLPVGIPLVIRPDDKGLYTEVRVFDGPAGDNLLAVARGLKAHGQTLGLSIGFRVRDSKMERTPSQGLVRRLLDIDLVEFSYAARQSIANPAALMTSVKQQADGKTGAPGSFDAARMALRSTLRDSFPDAWAEIEDLFADRLVYSLSGSAGLGRAYYQASYSLDAQGSATLGDPVEMTPNWTAKPGGDSGADKTAAPSGEPAARSVPMPNELPDSAFLFIQDGGVRDDEGKTVPRSLRHLPYRDAEDRIDGAEVQAVLAALPGLQVDGLDAETKSVFQARLRRMADQMLLGKTADDGGAEWQAGAAVQVRALGYGLLDASETIAAELKAMSLLRSDTKANGRLRPELRQKLADLAGALTRIVEHAELIDRDQDGAAMNARYRSQLALLDLEA